MKPGKSLRRHLLPSAAVVVTCLIAASPAAAMSDGPDDSALSSRLEELAKPSLRSASPARQAKALSLASDGPGSLLRQGGRVYVDVRFDSGAAASLDDLRAVGARVVNVSRRYQTVTVAVPPASLPGLTRVARVEGVSENLTPLVSAVAAPAGGPGATPCAEGFGAATSEGDLQLNAMKARTAFGVDGSGVTVGILSDSFDNDAAAPTTAAADVVSGDLPGFGNICGHTTPVDVVSDPVVSDASDEGRAMAQIVHDLAPGATLAFDTAFLGETAFADSIREFADAGVEVIVDDVSYFEEPFFQEGPIAVAVGEATAKGSTYLSSAGNNNLRSGGNDFPSWEAPSFRDTTCPPALEAAAETEHCMDFDPGGGSDPTFGLTVNNGATLTVDLQWQQPWNGVTADLDVFLLDFTGNPFPAGSTLVGGFDNNIAPGVQRPVEVFQWENDTGLAQNVSLAINRCSGLCNPAANASAKPRLKVALLQNGSGVTASEYLTSSGGDTVGPTIFGHNGAAGALSVGAIRFNTTTAPETFSSRGPVTHYFGPVVGLTPAAPLGSPAVLKKPDLVATDGGANTFFGSCSSNVWRFFGTSAAAPHAAAVAALELEANPSATVAQVKKAQTENALAVGAFPEAAVGKGRLDAVGALEQITGSAPGGGIAVGPGFAPPVCPPVPPATPEPEAPPVPTGPVTPVTTPTVASVPPTTSFAQRPHRLVRTKAKVAFVSFRFRSDQSGTFVCSIDSRAYRACHRKLARWFGLGPHSIEVAARNSSGEKDPTPAVFHFQVKQVR